MVAPIVAGLATALVGNAARSTITTQVAGGMIRGAQMAGKAMPEKSAIRESVNAAISQRGMERAGRVAAGYAAYRGVTAASSNAATVLDSAVGYAVKKADFEVLLAAEGLNHAVDAQQQGTIAEEAELSPHVASGENYADIHEVQNGRVGVSYQYLTALPDARAAAISMWSRFGYMVNRAINVQRLDVMDRYSYWKISEAGVTGNMPAEARQRIANEFANGVTVWSDISEIGTRPNNNPRGGITY